MRLDHLILLAQLNFLSLFSHYLDVVLIKKIHQALKHISKHCQVQKCGKMRSLEFDILHLNSSLFLRTVSPSIDEVLQVLTHSTCQSFPCYVHVLHLRLAKAFSEILITSSEQGQQRTCLVLYVTITIYNSTTLVLSLTLKLILVSPGEIKNVFFPTLIFSFVC